ncbi:MAG: LacI family DNA-binding transcriptional regulator [Clostridia bacterium]|nr:LacI family DNA-binding transcriptional regulator [Clostridia bacterium]
MTLTELARLAHVSTSTASKAFALSPEVNEQTRDMIFEVAKANGCFKKFYRAEYPGLVFAVICPEFDSTYYSAFISKMQRYLSKYNSEVAVAETGFSAECEARLIEYYERFQPVDGIILINGHAEITPKNEIPIATVNCFSKSVGTINVKKDLQSPITDAVLAWKRAGVQSVGFIGEPHTNGRRQMVRSAIKKVLGKVNEEYFVTASERFERGGYLGALDLINKKSLPRAIICAYDRVAMGAMRAFAEHGVRVPEDVAIIGIDDAHTSAYSTPSLSSISHEIENTCKALATSLMAKIKGEAFESSILIKCELKERESSKIDT